MAKIRFEGVSKLFEREDGAGFAVRNLTFEVREGEMVAIVGKTGCGKSTTFNLLLGLLAPTEGRVLVDGHDPYGEFQWFRGRIGTVFQEDRLMPWRTAVQNVELSLEILNEPPSSRRERAMFWLRRLGLEGYEQAYPHQLSGGMRQRVSIARAFVMDPDIILCDEAFSALDEITADRLRSDFLALVRGSRKTGLFITHSIHEAVILAERVLVFGKPGRVLEDFRVPANAGAKELEELKAAIVATMDRGESLDEAG